MGTPTGWPALERWVGIARSLLIYHAVPLQHTAFRRFYRQFIRRGDLCFDIGAHVGGRARLWTQLGARVVALEPQPHCMALLRRWYGKHPDIVLVEQAAGAREGAQTLWVSRQHPTVSTLAEGWRRRVATSPGFSRVRWDEAITVAVTTLDALIATHGRPAFCKIDVEGAELEVLMGLSQALPALSFEYLPATADLAIGCVERLAQLGRYQFNWTISEWPWLRSPHWLGAEEMAARLRAMPARRSAGDVYARLAHATDTPAGAGH